MTSFNQATAVPSARMPIGRCAFAVLLAVALGACNTDAQTDIGFDPAAKRETLMTLERKWSEMYGRATSTASPNAWPRTRLFSRPQNLWGRVVFLALSRSGARNTT